MKGQGRGRAVGQAGHRHRACRLADGVHSGVVQSDGGLDTLRRSIERVAANTVLCGTTYTA